MTSRPIPPDVAALADHVQQRLRAAGLTQMQIADVLGIPQPVISRRFLGKTPWRAHELQTISDRFGIPLSELYPASAAAS
ncbi:helix-turn-helix domain-containing protein [Pseudonocardia sp. D17]|uniref:helix-turn-helix domain-containing protein n=1 Tax=Pseudonocardia sp. D17 TaxID=882661 RepID=UPI002B393536|nr:hypothetical protein PSD17_55010 [Pseudonocardia sp. D17]